MMAYKDSGMSFSEWCDRKFTNMYSHDEFASLEFSSASPQTKNDTTSPRSIMIKQPEGNNRSLPLPAQAKSFRRVVSTSWTPSKNAASKAHHGESLQPPASNSGNKRTDCPNTQKTETEKSCVKKVHSKAKTGTPSKASPNRTQSKDSPTRPEGKLQSRRRKNKSSQDAPVAPDEVAGKKQETEKGCASFDSGSSESNSSKRNHSDLDLSPGNRQLKTKMSKNALGGSPTKNGSEKLHTESSYCVDESCSGVEVGGVMGHTEKLTSKANCKKSSITVDCKNTGLLQEITSQQQESFKPEQKSVKKGKHSATKKVKERVSLTDKQKIKQKYVDGEFDVESWDSTFDYPEMPSLKQRGAGDDQCGSSLEKGTKTSGKLRSEDKSSKMPRSDDMGAALDTKQIEAILKKKSPSVSSDAPKTKREKSTKGHKVKQKPTASPSSTKDQTVVTSPSPDEKKVPRTKSSRTKCDQEVSRAVEMQLRSLSPRPEEGGFFSKRVLQSVLGPSLRGRQPPRPKSAGSLRASDQSKSYRVQQQQRKSWPPAAKVHLDHIYDAFNFAPQEDEPKGTGVTPTKQVSKSPKKPDGDSPGVNVRQSQLEKSLQQQTPHRAQSMMQPRSVFQILVDDSEKEKLAFLAKAETLKQVKDKVSQKKENVAKSAPRFTPRSLAIKKCISGEQSDREIKPQSEVSNAAPQKSENAVDPLPPSELPCPRKKKDFILEWLDKHEEPTASKVADTLPFSLTQPKETTRRGQEDLEAGELSNSSGSGDAWETLIDGIMSSNNEEFFRRKKSNKVRPKHQVSPFKVSSYPEDKDLKPLVSPLMQKNVATVSPYYVCPPAIQTRRTRASTWTGPTPLIWGGGQAQTSPRLPYAFDQFSSEQNSTYFDQTTDGRHRNAESSQYGNTEAPGEYPWKRDGFQTPCTNTGDCESAFTTTGVHQIRSLSDNIPPRFLKRDHQRSRSSLPFNSHQPTSGPRCVYTSGTTRSPNLVAIPSSNQFPATRGLTSPLSEVKASPPSYRPWSTGSAGWSSSMNRTPGTIVPTRFTPWTNEVTTSSPWKTYQRPHHPSSLVELSPVVDYPVSSVPYIDTHCHIDFLYQRSDFRGTFKKFSTVHNFPRNYAGCLAVFCTPESFKRGAIWEDLVMEDNIWAAFGCHPHHAKSYDGVVEENIIRCMKHPKAIALGEIGLDYSNRCTSDRPLQLQVFRRQLEIAVHTNKPLVIHSRDAEEDTLSIMSEIVPRNYKIHRHCFTGSPEEARRFFQAFPKAFIGLTALVTFPTAYPVHRTASEIPLEKIILETDAPYFLPKQCPQYLRWANPSMAIFVAARIAQLRGLPLDEVLYIVRANTKEMYGI
ncbi:uncharacterized protein [Asterias amurensis]|uniref:uncharacterized protein isoform X2 n=1 Tax=Asterias amurensis TaxID=7602 RepID=UPI003AB77619